mmetsp:Transcript_38012/g.94468  ORF Transcript_38012/g.94468 Transcript_38012/m.94468 type:complete len:248 (-) Transcript_38012:615-1358(-)
MVSGVDTSAKATRPRTLGKCVYTSSRHRSRHAALRLSYCSCCSRGKCGGAWRAAGRSSAWCAANHAYGARASVWIIVRLGLEACHVRSLAEGTVIISGTCSRGTPRGSDRYCCTPLAREWPCEAAHGCSHKLVASRPSSSAEPSTAMLHMTKPSLCGTVSSSGTSACFLATAGGSSRPVVSRYPQALTTTPLRTSLPSARRTPTATSRPPRLSTSTCSTAARTNTCPPRASTASTSALAISSGPPSG